jgi:hypothetical protein
VTLGGATIWELLAECVRSLSEPFRASEVIGWFRRHHPEVNEGSIRAHIQGATSNVSQESRGAFASRTPLLTRLDHGLYGRYQGGGTAVERRVRQAGSAVGPSNKTPGLPDWFTEDRVQSLVVSRLVSLGWSITAVADTASKARGIDVVARRGDRTIAVEVKGYPGRDYADPNRKGERKPSHPSAQAATYFAQAVLSTMRLRTSRPELVNVIALPDFPRYRALAEETRGSLIACGIDVWLVAEDGSVGEPLRSQL